MEYNDKVFITSKKRFGLFKRFVVSSGYDMYRIEYQEGQSDLYYPNDIINTQNKISNSELWNLIDEDIMPNGMIIIDKHKIEYVYYNDTIKLYHKNIKNREFKMVKGDKWILDRIEEWI